MLQGAMLVWFILTGLSLVFVVWDSAANGVTSWVQRLAWILVTFYTGPIGAFLYVLACRRPFTGGHDRYTAATWKQGLNSEMHCLAGDATGIVIAAAIVPAFGLANGWDALIEYAAGFFVGLFVFQALMMVRMYAGSYLLAVRKTFFAETVSMNLVMTGMIPVMLLLAHRWTDSMDPLAPEFWFRMSLATIAGGILAFPVNRWLVASRLKHGCMTLPDADGPAPGLGHHSPESADMAMAGHEAHAEHRAHAADVGQPGRTAQLADASHRDIARASPKMAGGPGEAGSGEHDVDHTAHAMAMQRLPFGTELLWIVGTFGVLAAAVWATAFCVPVRFD
jgi:hypothetical protein